MIEIWRSQSLKISRQNLDFLFLCFNIIFTVESVTAKFTTYTAPTRDTVYTHATHFWFIFSEKKFVDEALLVEKKQSIKDETYLWTILKLFWYLNFYRWIEEFTVDR